MKYLKAKAKGQRENMSKPLLSERLEAGKEQLAKIQNEEKAKPSCVSSRMGLSLANSFEGVCSILHCRI